MAGGSRPSGRTPSVLTLGVCRHQAGIGVEGVDAAVAPALADRDPEGGAELDVDVRRGPDGIAGGTQSADDLAALDAVADLHPGRRQVRIQRGIAKACRLVGDDDDDVAVALGLPRLPARRRVDDGARERGADLRAELGADVDAVVRAQQTAAARDTASVVVA